MKSMLVRLSGGALVTVALAALAAAAFASGPPVCPEVYAPVICSNGHIYPNLCYAQKAHAKNCVPYIDPIPPL